MLQDFRFAIRTLWRTPGFTAIAVAALALGIGANSAIFTVVNGVVLRPLPFADPARLAVVYTHMPNSPMRYGPVLDPYFLELQKSNTFFENVASFSAGATSMTGFGEPIPVHGQGVTSTFWSVLKVNPALGRVFVPGQEQGAQQVVLSDTLWRSHFGADRSVLGKSVTLDGTPHTIIGVMPPEFSFPAGTDLWTRNDVKLEKGRVWMRQTIGRLKPGATMDQAGAEARSLFESMNAASAHPIRGLTAGVTSLQELLIWKVRPSLLILLGAVGFILLIACANVANLLLARGAGRKQEVAVRTSLGASRFRLIRQLLTESLVLSLLGGALGLLIASWSVWGLLRLVPPGMLPRATEISINAEVLGFALLLSLLTTALFGVVPAIQLSRARLNEFLKQGDTRTTAGQGVRNVLVVGEVALSLILLIGAGLMIKSFVRLRSVNPGFNPEKLMVLSVDLPFTDPRTPTQLAAFHEDALGRLAALPGVVSAGAVNWLPLDRALIMGDFYAEGKPRTAAHFNVAKPGVTAGYFHAMGIPLLRGRMFDEHDTAASLPVAVVTKSVAQRVWGGEDPIGKRVTLEDDPAPSDWLTVVGVVDDVKQQELGEKAPIPAVYQPLGQVKRSFFLMHVAYVVRATGNLSALAGLMRTRFHEIDRNQPIQAIHSMDDMIDTLTAEPRFYSRILGSFSALALVLASLGIYGVMAYSVAQRTREIGIRVALGAQRRDILGSVLFRSFALILAGVAAGLAGAYGITRVLATLLFEVRPTDGATFAGVSLLLIAIALLASYVPARRATAVDPMVALRYE